MKMKLLHMNMLHPFLHTFTFIGCSVALLVFALLLFPATIRAEEKNPPAQEKHPPVQLFLDGKVLNPETPPVILEGNTLVPVRIIAEHLGAEVKWDGQLRKVSIRDEQKHIEMVIDDPEVSVNGETFELNVPPRIMNGYTMVPIRFVSERLGLDVEWDGLTYSIFLYRKQPGESAAVADKPGTETDKPGTDEPGTETDKPETDPVEHSPEVAISEADPDPADSAAGQDDASGGSGSGQEEASGIPSAEPVPVREDHPDIPNIFAIQLIDDYLYIQSTGAIEAKVSFLDNPQRLIVDLPGSELDASMNGQPAYQNGEIVIEHPNVKKIRYALFSSEPSTVRVVFDLKTKVSVAPVETKDANLAVFQLKAGKYTVVIDAGHGGKDSGAVSATGKYEKDFNLSMVNKVKALLDQEEGISVYLTRSDDTFVPLDDRAAFANGLQADLFLSIHGNKYVPEIRGTETYYYRDESLPFANLIHKYLIEATGFPDRGVRKERFRVVTATSMPAVLLEIGYLSNPAEEAEMFDEQFQERVARAIVAAIKEYLGMK